MSELHKKESILPQSKSVILYMLVLKTKDLVITIFSWDTTKGIYSYAKKKRQGSLCSLLGDKK